MSCYEAACHDTSNSLKLKQVGSTKCLQQCQSWLVRARRAKQFALGGGTISDTKIQSNFAVVAMQSGRRLCKCYSLETSSKAFTVLWRRLARYRPMLIQESDQKTSAVSCYQSERPRNSDEAMQKQYWLRITLDRVFRREFGSDLRALSPARLTEWSPRSLARKVERPSYGCRKTSIHEPGRSHIIILLYCRELIHFVPSKYALGIFSSEFIHRYPTKILWIKWNMARPMRYERRTDWYVLCGLKRVQRGFEDSWQHITTVVKATEYQGGAQAMSKISGEIVTNIS